MKKEVVIAIIGGFVLGLIITFGIATAQQSIHSSQPSTTTNSITPTPPPPPPSHTLFINTPSPNSVNHAAQLMVSGSSSPNSYVGVVSTSDRNSTIADAQGNFSLTIELTSGANILDVTSFNESGQSTTRQIKTVYAPIINLHLPSPTPTPTPTRK
jgi:hypothetical protein